MEPLARTALVALALLPASVIHGRTPNTTLSGCA
jgi:hypothetical protein